MSRILLPLFCFATVLSLSPEPSAQTINASLAGRVFDPIGAIIPGVSVSATHTEIGLTRSTVTDDTGRFRFSLLPVGPYRVTAELEGFQSQAKNVVLTIAQNAEVDFSLQLGAISDEIVVDEFGIMLAPTRSSVDSVVTEVEIQNLPVNGRQFIDFTLLAPGVQIGETTSGSTDVIVEPVTKLSFAGQNIHFNFVAIDGTDNISTASGIHKTTPSQEAVQEFQVINVNYSTEFGRAVGGIVNIVTKSGTNEFHGSLYEYFQNDNLNATSSLATPGLTKLQQNQFGVSLGGPVQTDRTFFFANYEGQRRLESPFYNSALFENLDLVNATKATFGLPAENLNVTRTAYTDNLLARVDHSLSEKHLLVTRYFFNDGRFTNQSPLNDGFDAPSTFRDNFFRDQSLVGSLNSAFSATTLNEFRVQYARRTFDFPSISAEPHLEIANTFTTGINRGNPDFYRESRFEVVEKMTLIRGDHELSFGGNFNWVRTEESFPLFYPFEATFACLKASECPFSYEAGSPFVIFFQRNDPSSNFTEPTILPSGTSVFSAGGVPESIRELAKGTLDHTYNGFFFHDNWKVSDRLTVNFGLRYEWETWPRAALDNDLDNLDPRFGFAFDAGTRAKLVFRGGAGLFHGTIPSPLLACQVPSCGGVLGKFPGREAKQGDLDARTRLFAFASAPGITNLVLNNLLTSGTYPDAVPAGFCPSGFLSSCGFFGDAVIVRFARDHQAPYGIHSSLGVHFEPYRDWAAQATYLRVQGVQLGSFFNVNQPPATGQVTAHDSNGNPGPKSTFFCPPAICGAPGLPGTLDPRYAVFFEADSRWNSSYNGLLLNLDKRFAGTFGLKLSYTWSKGIDDGPNPSFVLIPQNSSRLDLERALSADHVEHRFVASSTIAGPTNRHPLVDGFRFGLIVTLQSPHFFTKFAGFDANGDVFGTNDRVGIEPRNTFQGDALHAVDFRLSRKIEFNDRVQLELIGEMFNAFNWLNVRFFNTVYGAADFCPVGGPAVCGSGPLFVEGSPNPRYGTPRAVHNPRQIQFALRLTF